MRSLEIVVRPVVMPDVRPATIPIPAQTPEDDEKRVEIIGRRGLCINLAHTRNESFSKSRETEKQRTYDLMRVYNPEDQEQYVDVEVAHRLRLKNARGEETRWRLSKPRATDNTEILEEDLTRNAS